jgi:hypothetical protein
MPQVADPDGGVPGIVQSVRRASIASAGIGTSHSCRRNLTSSLPGQPECCRPSGLGHDPILRRSSPGSMW